ncbi:MAG: 1-acyl-sn-glycerol-3-phosphate acyltransferase [Silicimonas sp.]|nr:1-acyl-sn-glycerol-3-phosphate acyltransferase [Silicimonas sp.]
MSDPTWVSEDTPAIPRPKGLGWLRVFLRGFVLALVVFGGLLIMVVLRIVEAPVHGARRPWTPFITVAVCRAAFRILGMEYVSHGRRMDHRGAVVANHSSWMDIFALNAGGRVYFVSKSEVAAWPGIGLLARVTGTVFINRDRREAAAQKAVFEDRLAVGHKLLFFPEGTSTDGQRVLAFKPTLFAAFFSDRLRDVLWVQPVTVVYRAPEGREPRFYGWWGDMEFGEHLLAVLAQSPQGRVEVFWHAPVRVADFADRKTLAKTTENAVSGAHPGEKG